MLCWYLLDNFQNLSNLKWPILIKSFYCQKLNEATQHLFWWWCGTFCHRLLFITHVSCFGMIFISLYIHFTFLEFREFKLEKNKNRQWLIILNNYFEKFQAYWKVFKMIQKQNLTQMNKIRFSQSCRFISLV